MVLILLVACGFGIGRWLGMTRAGFVTLAAIAVGSTIVQIAHLATTASPSRMTMLPIVVGALLVIGQLLGALPRRPSHMARSA